nr:MAG TPA: hypothetical protein [Caudoviricetes sp.]
MMAINQYYKSIMMTPPSHVIKSLRTIVRI